MFKVWNCSSLYAVIGVAFALTAIRPLFYEMTGKMYGIASENVKLLSDRYSTK
jgi:hypothetical protein